MYIRNPPPFLFLAFVCLYYPYLGRYIICFMDLSVFVLSICIFISSCLVVTTFVFFVVSSVLFSFPLLEWLSFSVSVFTYRRPVTRLFTLHSSSCFTPVYLIPILHMSNYIHIKKQSGKFETFIKSYWCNSVQGTKGAVTDIR